VQQQRAQSSQQLLVLPWLLQAAQGMLQRQWTDRRALALMLLLPAHLLLLLLQLVLLLVVVVLSPQRAHRQLQKRRQLMLMLMLMQQQHWLASLTALLLSCKWRFQGLLMPLSAVQQHGRRSC
jgi:hypothetical protein